MVIGSGSCKGLGGAPGQSSCKDLGIQASNVTIGDGSCIGENSPCHNLGMCLSQTSIADNSCVGQFSCSELGYRSTVTVGTDSCIGDVACTRIGKLNQAVTIGAHSCKCDHCRRCLCTIFPSAAEFLTIPDNSFNKMGTGLDSICKGINTVNEAALP